MVNNQLYCQWIVEGVEQKLEDISLCTGLPTLEFGDVEINKVKTRTLRVTNINPVSIMIDQVTKEELDDLSVELVEVTDFQGKSVTPTWQHQSDKTTIVHHSNELINSKRIKKQIKLYLLPFESAYFKFSVTAKMEKQRDCSLEVRLSPAQFAPIPITYSYSV